MSKCKFYLLKNFASGFVKLIWKYDLWKILFSTWFNWTRIIKLLLLIKEEILQGKKNLLELRYKSNTSSHNIDHLLASTLRPIPSPSSSFTSVMPPLLHHHPSSIKHQHHHISSPPSPSMSSRTSPQCHHLQCHHHYHIIYQIVFLFY